jgi:hypothetical protein
MCLPTTPVANKQTPVAPVRFCRWLTPDPAANLNNGLPALLLVSVKGVETVYAIARHAYLARTWLIMRDLPDGSGLESYTVDATFGDDPAQDWGCTCKDYVYRSHRRQEPGCKHARFLCASLNKIGVKP